MLWSSSNGLGTFTPNNAAATIYIPATGQTGLVTLTLTASSTNGVCPTNSDNVILDIIAKPIVEAGTSGTICQTSTYTVTNASVQNHSSYSWSVIGQATIQAGTETTLNPVIVPNAGASGIITVTLNAIGIGNCPVSESDSFTIQINPAPVVNAGTDGFLCEGTGSFQLNGIGSNADTYSWTTTGGGFIQSSGIGLTPQYVPSLSDFNLTNAPNGVNVITITLNGTTTNGCGSATDSMQLTLYAKPKINAGNDLISCGNDYSVSLLGASVSNYNSGYSITWTSTGNGTFDYSNSNGGIKPDYIFGSNDTSSVTLTMLALPNSNCPQVAVTDSMTISINQNPTISTTSNVISMCGETFTLPDLVTVSNSNNLLWTNITGVSGTPGALTNATTETPNFTPSVNEIANGFVLLQLTATPISGCNLPATTTIRVNLQPKAIINLVPNAPTNITACQGELVTINNIASVINYSTYTWTENGTGYIEPATLNSIHPVYQPGTNETGVVTFTLQATNIAPCIGTVSQTITLIITGQPTVNAGPDATICQNSSYTLGAALAANYTTLDWSSCPNPSGIIPGNYNAGSFNNTTIQNPIYTPSQDDIDLGYVYLTIKALNPSCNSVVTDIIKLTINSGPSVSAGSDATICEGMNYTLSGTSQANTTPSIIWTASDNSSGIPTSGHIFGTFTNNAILNPVYTPSVDDINTGHVYLTLTGNASGNCPDDKSTIKLTIVKKPTVSTTDVQMCMDTPQVTLVGDAFNYQSLNWSIFSGPGSIINNGSNPLQPTFVSGVSGSPTSTTTVVKLIVTPLAGCPPSSTVYDDLIITIQPLPVVEAGQDGWLCYTPSTPIGLFTINGTSVTNNGVNITNTIGVQNWNSSSAFGIFTPGNPFNYQSNSNNCNTEILTLSVNGTGACANSNVSDSVTLNLTCASPNLGSIFPATTQVCEGQTITYNVQNNFSTITNNNVQNYTWTVPGSTIISGQGTNSIQVLIGSNSGTISVTATNACGFSAATLPITVTSLPTAVATITGPQTVCAGSTGNVYNATTIPGATSYVWTLPSGSTVTTITNSITISFGLTEVSGNLTVFGSNSCGPGTVSVAYPITINQKPSLSSTLTPPAICSGTLFNYTPTSTIAGSSFTWTRTTQIGILPSGLNGNGAINEILINTTPNVISVVYQITTTSLVGCTRTESISVDVNPEPRLTSNSNPGPICSGTAFNYTPTSSSTGIISWVRNSVTGISVTGPTSGSGVINDVLTNTTNAPITVTYQLTIPANANGCINSTPISLNIIVNPAGQLDTQASAVVCNGTNQNIVLTTLNTGGTTNYSWSNTAQSIGLINGSGANLPTFIASNSGTVPVTGTILVTPTFSNAGLSCAGAPMTFTITVNPSAQLDQPVTQVFCNGTNATINLNTLNTGGTISYSWTSSNSSIGLLGDTGNFIPSFTAVNGGTIPINSTIVVTPSFTNAGVTCTGPAKTFIVTVNPSAQVNQPAPVVFCNGNSATINFTTLNTGGTTNYSWANNDPSIGLLATGSGVSQSFIATNSGTFPVIASVVVTPSFANAGVTCSGPAKSYTITVNPSAQVNQPASQVLCSGSATAAIAFTTVNTPGTTTYSWTNNNPNIGLLSSGNADNIPSFTAINTGTASAVATIIVTPTYTYNGVACTGTSKTFTITVNPLGQMNVIAPQIFCNGNAANINLTTQNTGGLTNYIWTTTNPSIGLAAGNGINLPSFTATNIGLVPETASISVIPTYTYGGVSCNGTQGTFTITVNPSAQVNPVTSQVVCHGAATTAVAFSTNNALGTTTYSWTNSDPSIGLAASGGTSTIPAFVTTNTGNTPKVATVIVTPTYTYAGTSCVQNQMTFTITVNPKAQVNQLAPQVFCNGANATINLTSQNIGGTTSYSWTNSDQSIGLINGSGIAIPSFNTVNSNSIPKVATVTVTPTFTNAGVSCTGDPMLFTIVVNPTAQVNPISQQVFCKGAQANINLTTTNAGGATTYTWTNTDTSIGLAASGSSTNLPLFTATNPGTSPVVATIVVTPTFTNAGVSCTSAPITFTITVNPSAIVDPVASQVLCNGNTSTLINFTTPNTAGTTTYSWNNSDSTIGLGSTGTGNNIPVFIATNTGNTPKTATISVTPTYTNSGLSCVGTPMVFTIIVNPSGQVNTISQQVFCNGNPAIINLSSINTGGINSYNWTNSNTSIGLPASSTGVIPPFTATNIGSDPESAIITVTPTFTNGGVTCTNASTTFPIIVNPSPQINPIASQVLCKGVSSDIINFTTTNFGGTTTYEWNNSNSNIGLFPTSGNGNFIPVFTATNTGTTPEISTITVTPTYTNAGVSCTGNPVSFTITVNPVPQVNTPNPQVFCHNSTAFVNFTTLNTAGATSYAWTNSNTTIGLAATGTGNILPFTAINTGTVPQVATIIVTPTFSNSGLNCDGAPITFTITINPRGQVNPVAPQVFCNGSQANINLTTLNSGGDTTYYWTNSEPSIQLPANGTSSNLPSFNATNTGTVPVMSDVIITPTFSHQGVTCTGNTMAFTIAVNPSAQVNQPDNQVYCNGSATPLINFTTLNSGGVSTYDWTINNSNIGLSSTTGTGTIPTFNTINTGTSPIVATVTVTPHFTNNNVTCDGTPKTFTITINPSGQVDNPTSLVFCNGETANINLTTPVIGGTTTYSWTNTQPSIGLAGTGNGIVLPFIAQNTTSTPVVGTVVITPIFTNQGVSCNGTPKTFTITVNPSAQVNLATSQVLCNGSTSTAVLFTTTNNPLGTTTYSWINDNTSIGLISGSTSNNILPFTASNVLNSPQVANITVTPSYTYNGESCDGVPMTFTYTVNPSPQVDQMSDKVFCNGSETNTISFTSSNTGGITTYVWTNSNPSIGLQSNGTGSIPTFNPTNFSAIPISATITVTPTYTNQGVSCTGNPMTFNITINPSAQVNSIATQVKCSGDLVTINLSTLNSVGSTTYSWTNSAPSIGLVNNSGNNITPFNAVNNGTEPIIATIIVTPSYTNGGVTCNGIPSTFTITVNPKAQVDLPANQVFCNGTNTSSINFTTENTLGSTTYNWTNSNPGIGLLGSGSGPIPSFPAINNGPIPLVATIVVTPTYTYAGVNCIGDPKTFTITINPSGEVVQPDPQVFCNASMATINLTTTNSVGVTSYSWTNNTLIGLPSGTGSNIPPFMVSNTGNSPVVGTIVVTPSFTHGGLSCVGNTKTFTVTVNPSPQVNIVDSQVICNGDVTNLVNFTTTNTGGTTSGVTTYNWTNNNPSINLSAFGSGDILPFTGLNIGSNVQVATITVTPTYTNAGVSCTGNPITFTITVNPKAQVIPPTSQVFCAGSPAVINLNSITTAANTTYQWTTTNSSIGLLAGSGSNIPPFVAFNPGTGPEVATITVTPTFTNAGLSCTNAPITFTITVNPKAQVNTISSIVKCHGDLVTSIPLSTNNTSGITTYTWTSSDPSIGLISGSGNIIPPFNAFNASSVPKVATITVTPTYFNNGVTCNGDPEEFTITVNPSGQANQITNQEFCNGLSTSAINLTTNNSQGNTTYTWTNSNLNIGLLGPGNNFIPPFIATNPLTNPITGTINVTPTFTNAGLSCIGNPMTFTISVNPNGQVNPINSFVKCNGDSVGLTDVDLTTINSGGTTTYSWTNTASIGLIANTGLNLPPFTATNGGFAPIFATVIVTPSFTNPGVTCLGNPVTFTITVNPSAQVNQPVSQVVCDGQATNAVIFNTLNSGGTTTYNWTNSIPTGYLLGSGNGNTIPSFIPTNTGTAPIIHTITVTPTYTANGITCIGTSKTFTITVNPIPQVNPVGPQVICNGELTNLVNFTTNNTGGVTTYEWTNSIPTAGLNAIGLGPIPAFTAVNTGTTPIVHTITVTPKFENGGTTCTGTPITFTITVNPTPQVITPLPLVYCNGNIVNLNLALNTIAGTTYNWTNSNQSIGLNSSGGTGLIPTFTAVNIGTLPIVSTITVSPVYSNAGLTCNGAPVTFTVTINPSPTASITGVTDTMVCQNEPQPVITFTGSNGVGPYTFNYQLVGPSSTSIVSLSVVSVGSSATITIPTSVFGTYTVTLLSVQSSGPNSCTTSVNPALNTAVVQVIENATVVPFSGALVSQMVCQNVGITPILFTIGGSSNNAYVTGLPSGMTQSYSSGILTISGTPTSTGVYNYVVHTTGSTNGCNTNYSAGTITVNANGSITANTPVNQTVCANSALSPIIFNLSGGATGGIVTFSSPQPSGITWSISTSNILTILGTPTTPGTYTYTVQSYGICGQSTATGTIIIKDTPTISLVFGNASPTVCMNSSFTTPIKYSITPDITPPIVPINMILSPGSILPNGVTFDSVTGIISGNPTQSGTFPYTITSDNGCGNTLSGIITVNPLQFISYISGNTNQIACQNSLIDPINLITSAGVTSVTVSPTLPPGISTVYDPFSNIVTISGTPISATSAGIIYTITTQGGCGLAAQTSFTLQVRPEATITVTSGSINQTVCQSGPIAPIVFTIGGGATGIAPYTLPLGLTLTQTGPTTYLIQGNPVTGGSFTITTTGCPKSLTINITNLNTNSGLFLNAVSGPVSQTICQTAIPGPIQPIIYDISGGVTGITSLDLPLGVTANIIGSQVIISGIPTISGVYNYSITTQPCSIVKSGVIKVSSQIYINSTITHISCHEENDGKILVSIAGGLPYINPANGQALYAIQWTGPNNFQQNQSYIEGLQAGNYTISVSDANGCPSPFPVTMTYTILDTPAITVSPNLTLSTPNTGCNGELGDMYFNISGGSGIYTLFTLQFLDPNSGNLITITPPFGNYYHITNLQAGIYYLTVKDSRNCTATTSFVINDFSTLSIDSITMDNNLCADDAGKIRVKVNSLDPNLNFFYNGVLVTAINLGNGIYELSINTPTPNGIVKVINSQNCSVTEIISTTIITPDFEFTSNDYENYGYFSVNQSIEFTQLFNTSFIPAEYHYIVWDFGDNTPFKEFDNVEDLDLVDIENVFHTYSANGIYEITLTVYNRFGCSRKITKIIKVGTGATIMLPTIFTPNNDGINDYFRPSTIGLKKVAMFIYDKWGNLVYEFSSDVSSLNTNWGWDGIEKGKTEPINNDYRYYIIGTTINDKNEEKEGRFLLVK